MFYLDHLCLYALVVQLAQVIYKTTDRPMQTIIKF